MEDGISVDEIFSLLEARGSLIKRLANDADRSESGCRPDPSPSGCRDLRRFAVEGLGGLNVIYRQAE